MAIVHHILEYSQASVRDGVIRGVKIVGIQSRNGYRYPVPILTAAVPLYEDAPVYVLHPDAKEKRQGTRNLDDHFGSLKGVHTTADGMFGDLHVKQTHPFAGMVLESDGRKFGLSHNVRVTMNEDKTEVTEIVSVNSVDLVDNPATTDNLFEEIDMETLAELVAANTALDEKVDALQGTLTEVLEAVKAKPDPKPKPKKRITALETITVTEGDEEAVPIGNSHADFLDVVQGFSTENKGAPA
jgi:hypothetical protein